MAGQKNTIPEGSIVIPKEDFEALQKQSNDNAALVEELISKLDQVQTAQLQGVGIDPQIAARALLPRKLVQFKKHYSRCAIPSKIQKGALIIEAFGVSAGDIVNIRQDELDRINGDFPDLLETDESKFVKKMAYRGEQKLDDHGRLAWVKTEKPITVKTLKELAFDVG